MQDMGKLMAAFPFCRCQHASSCTCLLMGLSSVWSKLPPYLHHLPPFYRPLKGVHMQMRQLTSTGLMPRGLKPQTLPPRP